mmetsp:Transcript_21276/g.35638  ORF Transcript_21276/g.35638 Transcript_21276/m.35638 type:complete len:266 (-) Transcript_21276:258-1055(-)|eukprot:CAMPEP_0174973232 /NCGR_PEP_ID=MMETSP0004_2-20121128/11112_1 /TAXON_ID=420556 /ORGANISM="Ochromonas sp., Strain CCMP1393" /LENGTH=265 /DNA_ID=CAMNT_0016223627 /DNA_START=143 /DNA_END=940 /DNA_ORIENTATION=+
MSISESELTKSPVHENVNDQDDSRMQAMIEQIAAERDMLSVWAKMDHKSSGFWSYHNQIGGAEGIALKIQHVKMDKDGDGSVSIEELKNGEEQQKESIDQALTLLVNAGVVAALIFSVLYSTALAPLEPSGESTRFLGDICCTVFSYIYYIGVLVSLISSITCIAVSTRMYLHLSVWMATLELKTWYITEKSMVPIINLSNTSIIGASVALPFGVTVNVTPAAGLISIIVIAVMVYLQQAILEDKRVIVRMHESVVDLVGKSMVN